MSREEFEVVVVGGSWAGLAAALQLGRARRRVLVVDAGRPRNRLARSSHGFLGQDGRSPAAILDTFRSQVLAYPTVEIRSGEATEAGRRDDDTFEVDLSSGMSVLGRRLILATGVVDDLPDVPGLAERWGTTVHPCPYCHGYEVAEGRLGVLATSVGSLQQALLLTDWSARVTLFTNGVLAPTPDQRESLAARGIRIETRAVESLVGNAPALTGIRLRDGDRVELDALFTLTRTRIASPLAEHLGCALEEGPTGPLVRTDAHKGTSVPGLFAAGDAARAAHSATWAAADGTTAGIAAHKSLALSLPRMQPA